MSNPPSKSHRFGLWWLAVVLMLPIFSPTMVADEASLKNLKSLYVLVEKLPSGLEQAGISREQVKTDAELRLRRSGILVAPTFPSAYLYININAMQAEDGWIFAVQLSFEQSVSLERDPSISTIASTWTTGSVARYSNSRLQELRRLVGDLVDGFINEYLGAQGDSQKLILPAQMPTPSPCADLRRLGDSLMAFLTEDGKASKEYMASQKPGSGMPDANSHHYSALAELKVVVGDIKTGRYDTISRTYGGSVFSNLTELQDRYERMIRAMTKEHYTNTTSNLQDGMDSIQQVMVSLQTIVKALQALEAQTKASCPGWLR